MHQLLLNRDIYDEVMLKRLPQARHFVWIVTADIKEPLINLDEFWQRQISRIKACELLMLIALEVSITQSLGIWLSPTG